MSQSDDRIPHLLPQERHTGKYVLMLRMLVATGP